MTDERIDHLDGLGYARDDAQALEPVTTGEYDAALFMAPTPVERIQAVAAGGRKHASEVHLLLSQGADRAAV